MSRVCMCDRCGLLIKKNPDPIKLEFVTGEKKLIRLVTDGMQVDLCDNCMEIFKRFWKGEKDD